VGGRRAWGGSGKLKMASWLVWPLIRPQPGLNGLSDLARKSRWGGVVFGILMTFLSPWVAWASDFAQGKGPLPVRNFNPVQLMFLALPGEGANVLPKGRYEIRFGMAESNAILVENQVSPSVVAVLKFETFRFDFILRRGITDRFEAGIEIPALYRDKGILDPFIISVEDAFKKLSPKRLVFNRGEFGGYFIQRNGITLLSGERGDFGLGDIVLQGKFLAWNETSRLPSLSVRGAVKLPTGAKGILFGSGKTDLGLGLALQKRLHPRWAVYLNQSVVFPLGTFLDTGLTLNPISTTILALEWIATPRISWIIQHDFFTSPFHGTGVMVLDGSVNEITFGFDYALRPHVLWQVFGIENFNVPELGAAADFTLMTTMSYRF